MTSHPAGIFCAALTPLTAGLEPDLPVFVAHAKHLPQEGCDGIALLGTTGEANSFSVAERQAILAAAVAGGIEPSRLLPGTGAAAITDTVALTKHALSLGVSTVVMLPPFYYKDIGDEGVFAAYAETVERVADPRLRVVLYHIPQMSAVPIGAAVIERLRQRFPDTFVGIKDSAGDFGHIEMLLDRFPGLSVLAGADPLLLPLLRKGGAGCITATSNLVARDLAFIFRHHDDPARATEVEAAQARVVARRAQGARFAQIASLKTLLAQESGHAGWRRIRPPLRPLSDQQVEALLVA